MPRLPSHLRPPPVRRIRGYTFLEAMLIVVILGIIGAGVGTAMVANTDSTAANENTLLIDNELCADMEALRATWQSFAIGSSTSQTTIGNQSYAVTIDIEKANPNGQGLQNTFYLLSIQIAGRSVCTYVSK